MDYNLIIILILIIFVLYIVYYINYQNIKKCTNPKGHDWKFRFETRKNLGNGLSYGLRNHYQCMNCFKTKDEEI